MAQRPQQFHVLDTATDRVIDIVPLNVFAATPEGRNPQKRVQVELGARVRSDLPPYAKTLREAGINP